MEQFRHIGEAMGSLKALMVFKDDIHINQRQCHLLFDILTCAYDTVAQEMRANLRFQEKGSKWKALEQPLRELFRIFREAELYVRHCLEAKNWWAKVVTLCHNSDCVEFHIHNLLTCMSVVIEAIEMAGVESEEERSKRSFYSMKYNRQLQDPKLFQWRLGKQYLVSQDLCNRFETVWKEDRWILLNMISERSSSCSKSEKQLIDMMYKILDGPADPLNKLSPCSTLTGSKDYQPRRRLGNGSEYKEIAWLGESFVLQHFTVDIAPLVPEVSKLLSLSHPNIMQILSGFVDEERKEIYAVSEFMTKDLSSCIKENCSQKKRVPFSLHVAVDLMLQIARGMEYLHLQKNYHGFLKTSNILVKLRGHSTEGYLLAKVSGFGLSSIKDKPVKRSSNQNEDHEFIWYAPEVLAEREDIPDADRASKCNEKADVYSYGMVCFEVLTGKVPFEDAHLRGDKMSRNIKAGERPLFPFQLPKCLTSLIKRCWQDDPNQRPSFSSTCRTLRSIKRFLLMNPDTVEIDAPTPSIDFYDVEMGLLKQCLSASFDTPLISQIPFQMFIARLHEKDKSYFSSKETSETGSEVTSICGDELLSPDLPSPAGPEKKSIISSETVNKKLSALKKSSISKQPGTATGRSFRPPQFSTRGRTMRMSSGSPLTVLSPRARRFRGHVSDSEIF
uniref:Protein kinase domain-containing protein n=1 Tax=Kalanchoe fedtschenkoi TaxID=63787 RepID=A0A7N0T4H3_KALFE